MSDTAQPGLAHRLSRFFAEMWSFQKGGMGIDATDLEAACLRSGLAHVRPATADEAEAFGCEVGDETVGLTAEGRAIIQAVSKA
jgi:hypothetical protein